MSTLVSIDDKKAFIRWFLKEYKLKKRECTWILKYLAQHETHLENIHFVRDIKFCPRAVIMSTHCSNNLPFRFCKQSVVTDNVEKTFHDIRLYHREPLYIQLNFQNAHQCPMYARVLEENPFTQDELFLTSAERDYSKHMLNDSLHQFQIKTFKKAIDHALDQYDRDTFLSLSEQLKELEATQHSRP